LSDVIRHKGENMNIDKTKRSVEQLIESSQKRNKDAELIRYIKNGLYSEFVEYVLDRGDDRLKLLANELMKLDNIDRTL